MSNTQSVSIIVVNWNGRKFLKDCLQSLSNISYKNKEIIFVDNASRDDSVSYVKKNFPRVKIIQNSENLGFAGGNNVGFLNARGDTIFLVNPDAIVEKDVLSVLIKALYSSKRIGAVQPKIVMYPQMDIIDSVGSFFLLSGNLYHYGREKSVKLEIYNKKMDIFSAKGAGVLIKREVLKKTGLFDDDYFMYFEDTDLSMRIWLSGYRIVYVPRAIVYHRGGESTKQVISSFIHFHSYKNIICTYLKNLSIRYLFMVIPSILFIYELVFFVYLIKTNWRMAWALEKAILWNLINIRKTLKKRYFVQSNIRVIEDYKFLPKLVKNVRLSYYYYQFFGGMGCYKD